jgi:hypothetical protein
MGYMEKLEELIHKEVDKEVAKGSLTPDSIRTIGYGIDVIKDLREIEKCDMEMSEGYSGHYPNRGYNIMPYYAYDDMSMDGRSYARRRDSMGRYSRDDSPSMGYSRENKIDQLQRMMDSASDPEERETYRRLIVRMENEKH